jgi:carbonic anhydrase/acetyltransferase-like protein (isoleucine patch superfamily)
VIIQHRGKHPHIEGSAFVAPNATLVGDVRIGPRSRVMYGATLDSEGSRLEVDECTIICENAVLRATKVEGIEHPIYVGDHVMVGPHATLLGCHVDRASYVATGATILHGAHIGEGAVVAVGALVHAGTTLPPEYFVPPNMIALGDPVELAPLDDPAALITAVKEVGFLGKAFGLDLGWEKHSERYERAMEVRSAEFAAHASDTTLPNTQVPGS